MKYDYWALKDKEFFKGVEKPNTAPQLIDQKSPEEKQYPEFDPGLLNHKIKLHGTL